MSVILNTRLYWFYPRYDKGYGTIKAKYKNSVVCGINPHYISYS